MALPNIDKLTSQLAMLPDMSLRQLAQMHKNDPYVLPLIISEDGRRKQMRAASQAQAGAQPQPRVADAAVQQIGQLPEEVGIGALSAPSMAGMPMGGITGEEAQAPQGMAGGGMVAFAHGGDVERYQSGGDFGSFGTSVEDLSLDELRRQALLRERAEDARISALVEGRAVPPVRSPAGFTRPGMANDPRLLGSTPPGETVGYAGERARNMALVNAATAAEERRAPAPSGARPAAAAAAAAPTSLQDIMSQARGMADSRNDLRLLGIKDELTELSEAEKADAREATRLTRERQAKFADAYKGREERLTKREAEVEGSKEQNAGLALLQAGLAIMSTPGGLAQAVGKGGQAGLASYASGLERIKTSQEKLADARDRLDDAKLNREELSAKELNDALMAERKAATNARKVGIDFLMKQHNFDREDAKMYFESGARLAGTREEIASRERTARISAGTPSGQMQMALALGGGDVETGLRKMTEIAAGKFDPRKAYTEYLVTAQKMPGTDVLSYSQFIGQFAIPTSPGNNPAAAPGTVRERP